MCFYLSLCILPRIRTILSSLCLIICNSFFSDFFHLLFPPPHTHTHIHTYTVTIVTCTVFRSVQSVLLPPSVPFLSFFPLTSFTIISSYLHFFSFSSYPFFIHPIRNVNYLAFVKSILSGGAAGHRFLKKIVIWK